MSVHQEIGALRSESSIEERWVKSHCQMCFNACPIEVHVKKGKAVKIRGDAEDPNTNGRLCARGLSGLTKLYDPDRIKTPLIRTNPEKGEGVDPKWREATWDEALDKVAEKLKKIRRENPNKLICSLWPWEKYIQSFAWGEAFGTKNGGFSFSGTSNQCANPNHFIGMLSHGALVEFPDLNYCKYLIVLGTEYGSGSHQLFVRTAQALADARERGLKMVVVDPRLSVGAGRADEWLPIKPATDLAFLLAMLYLLFHEYKIYDTAFLKKHTNAPYLVGPDRHFLEDPESGKPLVWDTLDAKAKVFDAPDIHDVSLEGEFPVQGVNSIPSFSYLKEEMKPYTPEWASEITDIPAKKIRKITKEFAEAANIGGGVTIDGREYPLRPIALLSYRGLQAHTNGGIAMMAQSTIMTLMGALSVPGGLLAKSMDARRFGGEPAYLSKGKDGIVRPHATGWEFRTPFSFPPKRLDLREYCPLACDLGHLVPLTVLNPAQYGFDYEPEALFIYHSNPLTNCGDLEVMRKALKKLDMVATINIYLDESTDYADVVLPEPSYLERFNLSNFTFDMKGLQVSQPVVPPLYNTKDGMEILIELAYRADFLFGEHGFNAHLNRTLALQEPFRLDLNNKYSYEEILDIQAKCHSQGERDLEWYKIHGNDFEPVRPDQKYLRYRDARLPLYFNYIKYVGDDLKKDMKRYQIEEKFGLTINWDQYKGIPYWEQSPIHEKDPEFDLYLIAYKSYLTTYADMATNPLIVEIAEHDPYHLNIMMNYATAKKKGLQDGQEVWLESRLAKVPAKVSLSEGIHPETVAISQGFGRWTKHPIAQGKGVQYNPHLPIALSHSGMLGGSMETAAKVRVSRREKGVIR
jgi:anaerobic selenocysteine-containing dehydrogenase